MLFMTTQQQSRFDSIRADEKSVEEWRDSDSVLVTAVDHYDGGWMSAKSVISPKGGVRLVMSDGSLGPWAVGTPCE